MQVLIPVRRVANRRVVRGVRPLTARGSHVAAQPSAARRGPRRRRRRRRRGLGRWASAPWGPSTRRRRSASATESLPKRRRRGLEGNTWRGPFRGRRSRIVIRTGLRGSLRRRGRRTLREVTGVRVQVHPTIRIRQSARITVRITKTIQVLVLEGTGPDHCYLDRSC